MKRFFLFLLFLTLIGGAGYYYYYDYYTIQKEQDPHALLLYGNVDVRQVDLGFRVGGRVKEMFFEEGDLVPQGRLMATLDKRPYQDLLRQAEAHVNSLKASLANAEKLLQPRQKLVGSGAISQEDFDTALSNRDVLKANYNEAIAQKETAETNLMDTEVFAPTTGTVLTRIREPGAIVRDSDPIYTLSILEPIWVRAYVTEPQLGLIYPGMPAEVYTDSNKTKFYKGQIGFISPIAEFTPKTVETTTLRTDLVYRLRIVVENPDQGLRQGMPVTVKLVKKSEEK